MKIIDGIQGLGSIGLAHPRQPMHHFGPLHRNHYRAETGAGAKAQIRRLTSESLTFCFVLSLGTSKANDKHLGLTPIGLCGRLGG